MTDHELLILSRTASRYETAVRVRDEQIASLRRRLVLLGLALAVHTTEDTRKAILAMVDGEHA